MNLKWIRLTLQYFLTLTLFNGMPIYSSHEHEELRALCLPIIQINKVDPALTADFMSEHLLDPFMKTVSLVDRTQQEALVSLVKPWISVTHPDCSEIIQRFAIIELTQKLAYIPADERAPTMGALNAFVELLVPSLKQRMHKNVNAVAPYHLARRALMLIMDKIPPIYWKATLENTRLALNGLSSSEIDLHYRSYLKAGAEKAGVDF